MKTLLVGSTEPTILYYGYTTINSLHLFPVGNRTISSGCYSMEKITKRHFAAPVVTCSCAYRRHSNAYNFSCF